MNLNSIRTYILKRNKHKPLTCRISKNGIIQPPIYYHVRDIKMRTASWSANIIDPGQTARMCKLTGSILVAKTKHFRFQQDTFV